VLETALVLRTEPTLDAAELRPLLPPRTPPGEVGGVSGEGPGWGTFSERVEAFERQLLERALARSGGNKAAAGRLLGLGENQIRYLCRKHQFHANPD
jgi:transcriptional regulator with GAF, ATPase, and Fis domain